MGAAFSKFKKSNSTSNKHASHSTHTTSSKQPSSAKSASSYSLTDREHPYFDSLHGHHANDLNDVENTALSNVPVPSNSTSASTGATTTRHPLPQPLRNNTSDKHLNTRAMHLLLLSGWIRQHCLVRTVDGAGLDGGVLQTCFLYAYLERMLFCLIASSHEKISTIQCVDVNNIYQSQYQLSRELSFGFDTNGVCTSSQSSLHPVPFPKSITQRFQLDARRQAYHVLFKCGSQDTCDAKCIILPSAQVQYVHNQDSYDASKVSMEENTLNAYIWDLPPIPNQVAAYGNASAFSRQHGLVTVGGTTPTSDVFLGAGSHSGALQLRWNEDTVDDTLLRWTALRRMDTGRAHASAVFIGGSDSPDSKSDDSERLFVCGGDLNGSVECYDFAEEQWSYMANTNVSRECAGIYYDAASNAVYLGGGHGAQRKMECYDATKNRWLICADTQCAHDFYPAVFKSSFHFNLLYIASPKSNVCEYLDEREGKWQILYDHEFHDKLFKVPIEVDFEQFKFFT